MNVVELPPRGKIREAIFYVRKERNCFMWYVASTFRDVETSEQAYTTIQELLKHNEADFSVFRLIVNTDMCVCIIGKEPSKKLLDICMQQLNKGIPYTLPRDVYEELKRRRIAREKDALPRPGSPEKSKYTERHDLHRVGEHGEEIALSPEERAYYEAMLRNTGPGPHEDTKTLPFIRVYMAVTNVMGSELIQSEIRNAGSDFERSQTFKAFSTINMINRERLMRADKYMFMPSAVTLLNTVFDTRAYRWKLPDTHLWIELKEPINTAYGENIRAVYLSNSNVRAEIDAVAPMKRERELNESMKETYSLHTGIWGLNIITGKGEEMFDFSFDTSKGSWVYLASHMCPYGKCEYPQKPNWAHRDLGYCLPCQKCMQACDYWARWVFIAQCIIARDYALSPLPGLEYPTHREEYEEQGSRVVGHGKNKRIIPGIQKKSVSYRLITFDATSNTGPGLPEDEMSKGERGENWLTMYGKDDLIYKRMHFEGVKRRYAGQYYNHLIERCKNEQGSFTEGAHEYTLHRSPSGHEYVVGGIKPYDKYVPMLKPGKRQNITVKRVVAHEYEHKGN